MLYADFREFPFRDCMKTPDRCRSGTPPSAENGLRGLYFGVWCYRRPTIGASPATFHTVSPGTSVNRPPLVHRDAMNGIIDASREEAPWRKEIARSVDTIWLRTTMERSSLYYVVTEHH